MQASLVSMTPVMRASLVSFTLVMHHQNFESSLVSLKEQSVKKQSISRYYSQKRPFNIKKSHTTSIKLSTLLVSLTPAKHQNN
jgi:hypothetical protein